jgi:hypothetical protein
MLGVCAVIGALFVDGFSIDGLDQRVALGIVLFAIGWSAMGMGVGAIMRQPIAGIVVLLGEAFVGENIIGQLKPGTRAWLPFTNGVLMTVRSPGGDHVRSVLGGGIFFFATLAVVLAVGVYLASDRDA